MVDFTEEFEEFEEVSSRKRRKYNVTLSAVGETWTSPPFNTPLRKLYVHNGGGELSLILSGGDGPAYLLPPGYANDFGNGNSAKLTCRTLDANGVATCYIHEEWEH